MDAINELVNILTKEILDYKEKLRETSISNIYQTKDITHEYIIGILFEIGRYNGYLSLPEFQPFKGRALRIDIVWVNSEGKIQFAFEIDKSPKKNSIEKLISLPDYTQKIIISYGYYFKPEKTKGTGIVNINLTASKLMCL